MSGAFALNPFYRYYKTNPAPDSDRLMYKPLPPSLSSNIASNNLKKALILGFPLYNFLNTETVIDDAKAAEKFIRQIAPSCQIVTLYENKFNKYNQNTTSGITVQDVKDKLQWLGTDIQPGQSVFLYYAGHGTRRPDDQAYPLNYDPATNGGLHGMIVNHLTTTYHDGYFFMDMFSEYTPPSTIETNSVYYPSDPKIQTYYPPNRNVGDELPSIVYDKNTHRYITMDPSDFCIVVPESVWITTASVSDSTQDIYYDNNTGATITNMPVLVENSERTFSLDSVSAEDKQKYALDNPHWTLMPDSYILIRDDDIRHYVVDNLPAGAKALLCFGACNSAGASDLKYELELMQKDALNNTMLLNYFTGTQIDHHLLGLTYNFNTNYADTGANVLTLVAARRNESYLTYDSDDISSFLYGIINSCYNQWTDNMLRRKMAKTAINLKSLYAYLYNKVYDSLPQLSIGQNLFPSNSTLLAFNNNNITVNNYAISLVNSYIYVNGEQIMHGYNNAKLIAGQKVYYIQNKKNTTLTIGDYDYDIIPPSGDGLPYLLDVPILFDFL